MKKYWIHTTITECVLCGCQDTYRERIYDRPKPEKVEDRYRYEQMACGCHFM